MARLALVVAAVVIRLPTLGQQLTEAHAFRQTQTAWTAVLYARDGIDLLHPQMPVLGPPWEVPFEFPLYQALAALPISFGVPAEIALRALCLVFFVLTAALLWLLLDRHAGRASADLGLVVFLFTPLAMLWSRTSSIEYVVTAGSVGFVLAAMELRTSWRTSWWWIALLAASVAMLVKPTTALFYVAPAVLVLPLRRRFVASAVLLVLPLALGIAWTVHADAIKAATPSTAFLTSSALTTWNFGTVAQRLNAEAWWTVLQRWLFLAGGLVLLPLLLRRPGRHWNPLVPWMLAAAVLPILVFFNLYVVHDYYLVAVTPAVAALVGLGAAGTRNRRPVLSAAFVAAALVVATFSYWSIAYDPDSDPDKVRRPAAQIAAETAPDDLVAIRHCDWSPAILYLADRRGFMLDPRAGVPDLGDYRVFDCRQGAPRCTEE